MKTRITRIVAITAALITVSAAFAQDSDEAMRLAKKLTEEGSITFNTANAQAMSAYYSGDAKFYFQSTDSNGVTVKEYNGRDEIERFYVDLFKDGGTIRSKNTVEYAKKLNVETLVIAGTFIPNEAAADPISIPFYQVRVKQNDKWLIHSLRIFYLPAKS
jgi:hypothetical protein